jgi:hypothetical protein
LNQPRDLCEPGLPDLDICLKARELFLSAFFLPEISLTWHFDWLRFMA